MIRLLNRMIAILFLLSCSFVSAQPDQHSAPAKPPQTARQALLEIIKGDRKVVQKHLSVEIQQMIVEAARKTDVSNKSGRDVFKIVTELAAIPSFATVNGLQTFDSGPVLFAFAPGEKQKIEVRVEGDDLSGNRDEIQISIHFFRDGQEQSIPFMPNIIVGLKQQGNIWRLNEIGGTVKLAVGDPKFFLDILKFQQQNNEEAQPKKASAEPAEKPERPKLSASAIVSMLGYAEGRYAQANPETGFTCNIADLANGNDQGLSEILDPQVVTGTYNGYRFTITGCDAKPSIVFHIIAEPLVAGSGSQAFCTDPTHNIRISDDGRGGTCLASGRVVKTETRFAAD